eukprot:CAMPEP_0185364944 /NCGR_PEP_ID=MMETSP1364-20130426/12735_1 /TAXON_ID=38817 /ORGANISM="Gephyrocapsa oceanica, Strain RCC1303" /LENGTH=345 /DNA_ID=CAMNT_0027965463 /DNA_START=107 /DNA_END=1144 /DNA_ORIENTATION=+
MVFFICETTNECIKKPKVEAHMRKHPNAWVFCCMDCGARFEGEAYKEHTSCMSEAQRYEGKFYVPKENKGEKKQQSWMESVLAALEAAPAASAGLKSYVDRLTQYDNLPRKKAKFVNFAKNSLNLKADREGIAEKLWALIESAAPAPAPAPLAAAATAPAAPAPAPAPAAAAAAAGPAANDPEVDATGKGGREKEKKAARKAAKKAEKAAAAEGEAEGAAEAEKKKKRKKGGTADGAAGAADGDGAAGGERKRPHEEEAGGGGGAGKKPVKWKKIVAKELTSAGGSMSLKALRKDCVAEVMAHPSHGDRKRAELTEEFDREMPRFKRFLVDGGKVSFAPEGEAES